MSNKPNRRNRGFDWYSLRQRFSIRKYHFGAASVLLGVAIASLATGPLAQAEEIDLSTQPAVEVPVPETPPAELPVEVPEVPVVESLPSPEPEVRVLEAPVAPAEVVPEVTAEPVAPQAPAAPEVEVPVERQAGIVYHASYVEETTKEEVGKGKPQATIVTTTEEKASAEVTVTADYLPKGYELSDPAKTSVTATVHEGQANPVAFSVRPVAVPETKVVTEGYTGFGATVPPAANGQVDQPTASGDAEGTSGFRAIENATRSANTVSYVTTEWVIPDEVKAANTGLDVAAGDASVTEATTAVPTAYKTTLPDGREVFMVLSLNSQKEPNKTTTFNNKYNKDYFFQFSISKEGEINKVYADLVDKRQNNKILESIEIAQGSTAKFNTLSQYENAGYTYRFQFTPDSSNSTSKNLKINNPNGGNVNTVIYDKVSPNSVGTELNIFNVLVPVRTTQETKYVVKATEKRAEETLATYIQKGALTGDSYTIAGALDFDKYELIAEDVPTVLQGDLAADYMVGAKTIQSIMTHNLVRVLEVTQKDGTHKAHIYLLNPDGPNRLALDRKTNITEADLTSENFIKFFTSEEIVPGKVNTLEGSYSYTSKHQFKSYKTTPHTLTNVITGETNNFPRNGENFPEGNFFIPEHQAVTLKGKDGQPFGFGGVQMRMVNDNVANEQHVTYYYAEKGSVIIHYVNDKGETLKRSATLVGHGATGEQYDTRNYKHSSVTTGDGAAIDQYYLRRIDPSTSTLRPVTEDPNELRRIVKIDAETGVVERDTVKELTYVYEKAAKALMEIYLRPVDVETGNVAGPDKLSHTIREQGEKGTIISKRITLDILQTYIDKGYEVISDGFSNKTTYFDSIEDGVGLVAPSQVYKIILRERIKTVTPDAPKEPNTPIDPTNPTGPKYPDGVKATDLNETVKRTIKYQYEDGSEARPTVEETLTFTRTAKVNVVTGALAYTPWTSADNDFNEVVSPIIDGYEADKLIVEAVQDVPATDPDTEVIVRYVKDAQKATITYQDDTGKQLGAIDEVTGKSGEPISYSTTARITDLTNQGYEVVRDDFTKDGGQVFDTDKASDQSFTVVVKARVVTVTPEDPKDPGTEVDPGNPDGPKWPDGVKASDLNQTVTRT
ncbi:TPA: YSIRK-type signal peptide-containing protein, partial [Streptococcus suis]